MIQQSHSWAYIWGKKKHNWKRSMLSKIHCSTTYNSQDMETKCPSTVEWIKKMWYI